jgi:hypothetical protein
LENKICIATINTYTYTHKYTHPELEGEPQGNWSHLPLPGNAPLFYQFGKFLPMIMITVPAAAPHLKWNRKIQA